MRYLPYTEHGTKYPITQGPYGWNWLCTWAISRSLVSGLRHIYYMTTATPFITSCCSGVWPVQVYGPTYKKENQQYIR